MGLRPPICSSHRDFLLLEKEPHLGGNAYDMEYDGVPYATGTAFLVPQRSRLYFAKEIGMNLFPSIARMEPSLKGNSSRHLGKRSR